MLCIVGKTCSGKNVIVNELVDKHGYQQIVTYTTRPMRYGEKDRKTYHFINTDDFMNRIKSGFFAEWKNYVTVNGLWYYGTALDDLENADEKSIIILTPAGYRVVKNKLSEKDITCIYLYANDATIKKRLIKRGDDPKEADRRIKHDYDDFKGFENEANRIVYNNEGTKVDDVVKKILSIVEDKK